MNLSDQSRVWIYQSNRPFTSDELPQLEKALNNFAHQWVSHNRQLLAKAEVLHDQFIILMVDESQAGASGCSIDSSVHFMRQIENAFGVNLFDRMNFAFQRDNQILTANRDEFARLYTEGQINDDTMVVDTLVKTKEDFDKAFLKPLAQSWHKRMV